MLSSLLFIITQFASSINSANHNGLLSVENFQDTTITEPPLQQPQKAPVRHIIVPGDLMIGGVFPVHAKSNSPNGDICGNISETRGVHRVEAMLHALDILNSELVHYKLGAFILDSCSNPAFALNQSLDFVRELIGATSDGNAYTCQDGSQPIHYASDKKNVVAVVGGSYSSVTVQVANLLRLFRIVQVSPASTNADLSDKSRFEFFARTVPSDNFQVKAMIDIAKKFSWSYVSLLYSADEYGELGAEAFKKEARNANICFDAEERVMLNENQIKQSIVRLFSKRKADNDYGWGQVVVLFVNTDFIPMIMKVTAEVMKDSDLDVDDRKIIWLASEGWDRNNDKYTKQGENWKAADGAIVLMLKSQKIPSFDEYYTSLRPGTPAFQRNLWLEELWIQKYGCKFGMPEDFPRRCEDFPEKGEKENFNADDKVQFTINAVLAISTALSDMHNKFCMKGSEKPGWPHREMKKFELCAELRKIDGFQFYRDFLLKVKFNDSANQPFHFTEEGDGPASYTILNLRTYMDSDGRPKEEYSVVGDWNDGHLNINDSMMNWMRISNGFRDDVPISKCSKECADHEYKQESNEGCCWACVPCGPYAFKPNDTSCVECDLCYIPSENRSVCLAIKDVHGYRVLHWTSPFAVLPAIFAIIGIMATVFVIVVYIQYNETPVVKASGRELSYILLVAMIMCYMMTFILIATPTPFKCGVKRLGIGFAFSTLYGAMFVKTNRIARIFSTTSLSAARPTCISPLSQLGLTGGIIGVQLLCNVIWLYVVPPDTKTDCEVMGRDNVVQTCNVPDHQFLYSLLYDVLLLILCTTYAVKTRQVPENFNETKFIGFAMYTTCILWICWVCFYAGTQSNLFLQISSLCISISMSANAVLACIFSPKVWIILFEKHKNVRKPDGEYMLSKRSFNNNRANSTYASANDEPTQYTALLSEQRRRSSRKLSQPSTGSSAHDTFL